MSAAASLLEAFENGTLDARGFSHRDHVAVAFELLKRHAFLEASMRYGTCLQTIATKAGAARKFNTTITPAFLGLIAERMESSDTDTFESFIKDNPDLLGRASLDGWYTQDRIGSDLARKIFLLPDKSPIEVR